MYATVQYIYNNNNSKTMELNTIKPSAGGVAGMTTGYDLYMRTKYGENYMQNADIAMVVSGNTMKLTPVTTKTDTAWDIISNIGRKIGGVFRNLFSGWF